MSKNLTSVAAKGFAWILAGSLAHHLLSLISLIILARLLTPAEFGVVSAAMIVIGFFQIFSRLGIGPSVVQKLELTEQDIRTANTLALSMSAGLALIVYPLAFLVAGFFAMPELEAVIKFLLIMLPLTGLTVVGSNLMKRKLHYQKVAMFDVICYGGSTLLVTIPAAFMGFGVWSLVYGYVAHLVIFLILVQREEPDSRLYGFKLDSAKALLNYGFGQSLGRLANYIAGQGDNIVVGRFIGAEGLGIYGRAYSLMMLPASIFGTVMDKTLFPLMSSIQTETKRLEYAYVTSVSVIAMLALPLSVGLVVFAEEIIVVLLGDQWMEVIPVFQVLTSVLVFRMSYKLSDSLSRAKGSVYRRAWRQMVYAGLVFAGAYIGHFWGLIGIAAGVATALFLNFALMLHLSQSLVHFSWLRMIALHLKHLVMALMLALPLIGLKGLMLSLQFPPSLRLALGGLAAFIIISIIWLLSHRLLEAELN